MSLVIIKLLVFNYPNNARQLQGNLALIASAMTAMPLISHCKGCVCRLLPMCSLLPVCSLLLVPKQPTMIKDSANSWCMEYVLGSFILFIYLFFFFFFPFLSKVLFACMYLPPQVSNPVVKVEFVCTFESHLLVSSCSL